MAAYDIPYYRDEGIAFNGTVDTNTAIRIDPPSGIDTYWVRHVLVHIKSDQVYDLNLIRKFAGTEESSTSIATAQAATGTTWRTHVLTDANGVLGGSAAIEVKNTSSTTANVQVVVAYLG